MPTPVESKEDHARKKLAALSDADIATLLRWFKEGFVLLPPGWSDHAAFTVLVIDEKARRGLKS